VIGSVGNALVSTLILVLVALASLPLLLIPFAGMVVPIMLAAWFNKRIYQYDALMDHASPDERAKLLSLHRGSLWKIGLLTAALTLVPLVNFFAPALAGLAFVHFCLGSLQDLRRATAS
jgi:uncharacterized protein involved in cysteine biosynthesis